MNLTEVIKKRYSVRSYTDKVVPDEVLRQIIELAKEAPSAGNIKPYYIYITSKKVTDQVNAPRYLVICANPEKSGRKYGDRGKTLYAIQDATILGAYIQLIAVDMGLSTVWIGAFLENRLKRRLKISEHLRPIAIMPIGYELHEPKQ